MRADALRRRSTTVSPSRKKKNAMKIDSVSCSTAAANVAPDSSANLRTGSTYLRNSCRSCAVSCAMLPR
jgi:hypothetical protein